VAADRLRDRTRTGSVCCRFNSMARMNEYSLRDKRPGARKGLDRAGPLLHVGFDTLSLWTRAIAIVERRGMIVCGSNHRGRQKHAARRAAALSGRKIAMRSSHGSGSTEPRSGKEKPFQATVGARRVLPQRRVPIHALLEMRERAARRDRPGRSRGFLSSSFSRHHRSAGAAGRCRAHAACTALPGTVRARTRVAMSAASKLPGSAGRMIRDDGAAQRGVRYFQMIPAQSAAVAAT